MLLDAIVVSDISQIGEARRAAARAGHRAGLAEDDCARLSIIATELATNMIRYATGGEMLIGAPGDPSRKGVELIAVDRGPGMADAARCMNDGYSSGGSLGLGLGAVRRLSTAMDFYSVPAKGTAIYSRVEADAPAAHPRSEEPTWCAIRVAAPGESECGDACHVARLDSRISAVVADGLGHGPLAAKAANEAVRVFEQAPFRAPQTYIPMAHEALRATRGAVLACALVDLASQVMVYAGVGNIAASLVAGKTQLETSLPSDNGTPGLQIGKVRQYQYTALEGDLLVMHSDGLTSRWKLADYPGLSRRAPALIAAVLYRDFKRGRDDVTVLVVRLK
jgi:anti-sigma regulatory factor (Ser/Thr protein kinase)